MRREPDTSTIKETGRTKQIEGYKTFETEVELRFLEVERSGRQSQLTLNAQVWLSRDVSGYDPGTIQAMRVLADYRCLLTCRPIGNPNLP